MSDHNDDLRQLFDEATSGIRPQGTFDDIRSRTEKVDPMTRRWFLPVMAAAAVMALAIGGAFYVTRGEDGPAATLPAATPSSPSSPASSPSGDTTATVDDGPQIAPYFAGQSPTGLRLYPDRRPTECAGENCALAAAATAAVSGKPADPDLHTLWPSGVTVISTTTSGNDVTIDLHGVPTDTRPTSMTPARARLAVQQLVYSMISVAGASTPVQISVDGTHTDKLFGESIGFPTEPAAPEDVLALVQILSPANGTKVPAGKVTVTGLANAFEANVSWELLVGGDAVVDSGFTMAAECCKLAPFTFDLTLQPGTYTLVVHDTDESGQGRAVNQDSKEIVVE